MKIKEDMKGSENNVSSIAKSTEWVKNRKAFADDVTTTELKKTMEWKIRQWRRCDWVLLPNEDWIKCFKCNLWAHDNCMTGEGQENLSEIFDSIRLCPWLPHTPSIINLTCCGYFGHQRFVFLPNSLFHIKNVSTLTRKT